MFPSFSYILLLHIESSLGVVLPIVFPFQSHQSILQSISQGLAHIISLFHAMLPYRMLHSTFFITHSPTSPHVLADTSAIAAANSIIVF